MGDCRVEFFWVRRSGSLRGGLVHCRSATTHGISHFRAIGSFLARRLGSRIVPIIAQVPYHGCASAQTRAPYCCRFTTNSVRPSSDFRAGPSGRIPKLPHARRAYRAAFSRV